MVRPAFVSLFACTGVLIALTAGADTPPAPSAAGRNLKVLGHLSEPELLDTMALMNASLGVSCNFCHKADANGNLDYANDEIDEKQTAREMIRMTRELNARHFGNSVVVSCQTCHGGRTHPVNVPPLPVSLPTSRPAPPDRSGFPSAAALLAKYEQLTRASELSSMQYEGNETDAGGKEAKFSIHLEGESVSYRVSTPRGASEYALESGTAWRLEGKERIALAPASATRLTMSIEPIRLPSLDPSLPGWRVRRKEAVRGRDAWMLERLGDGEVIERYWIEPQTGALLRAFRSFPTEIGRMPEQAEYDDYREAAGRHLPFSVTTSFTDATLDTRRVIQKITPGE